MSYWKCNYLIVQQQSDTMSTLFGKMAIIVAFNVWFHCYIKNGPCLLIYDRHLTERRCLVSKPAYCYPKAANPANDNAKFFFRTGKIRQYDKGKIDVIPDVYILNIYLFYNVLVVKNWLNKSFSIMLRPYKLETLILNLRSKVLSMSSQSTY